MTTFARVACRDDQCVTIVFWSQDGFPRCRMFGPTKQIFGRPFELDGPAEGSSSVPLALTVGMQFAADLAVPLVISDPEGLWNDAWGTLTDRIETSVPPAVVTTGLAPASLHAPIR